MCIRDRFSGTIRENLRWGDEHATDQEIEDACRLACADEFIEKMPDGYDTYIEQGGTNVSGGQKQMCIRDRYASVASFRFRSGGCAASSNGEGFREWKGM